jgi:hypothetical protein
MQAVNEGEGKMGPDLATSFMTSSDSWDTRCMWLCVRKANRWNDGLLTSYKRSLERVTVRLNTAKVLFDRWHWIFLRTEQMTGSDGTFDNDKWPLKAQLYLCKEQRVAVEVWLDTGITEITINKTQRSIKILLERATNTTERLWTHSWRLTSTTNHRRPTNSSDKKTLSRACLRAWTCEVKQINKYAMNNKF